MHFSFHTLPLCTTHSIDLTLESCVCCVWDSYRWALTWKGEVLGMIAGVMPGLAAFVWFVVTYGSGLGWEERILANGRCEWWDFNSAVVSAAAAKGIDVTAPTAANPNGYAPYSVHYASCKFCSWAMTTSFTVQLSFPPTLFFFTCMCVCVLIW